MTRMTEIIMYTISHIQNGTKTSLVLSLLFKKIQDQKKLFH